VFVQNPGIAPGSGFKPPHSRLQRTRTTAVFARKTSLYLFSAKSPIAVFDWRVFCRFLVGKKRRKNRPADKKG